MKQRIILRRANGDVEHHVLERDPDYMLQIEVHAEEDAPLRECACGQPRQCVLRTFMMMRRTFDGVPVYVEVPS